MMYTDSQGIYVLRASKKAPDGTKIYARDYGKKAFKIYVKRFNTAE